MSSRCIQFEIWRQERKMQLDEDGGETQQYMCQLSVVILASSR